MSSQYTAEQWQTFTAKITRAAERSGMTRADAEDIAQDIAAKHLAGRFARDATDLEAVVRMARAIARRAGTWAALGDQTGRDRDRSRRAERYTFPVRDASTAYPSPVAMAEAAERQGFPVERVHAVYGIGPTALHEAGTTPSIIGTGPGWTMPAPIPADRYPTDPNPASRLAARLRCLEQLHALAAGTIQPRPQEKTAEQTATEQADQAREEWQRFKRQGRRMDAGNEDRLARLLGDALYYQ